MSSAGQNIFMKPQIVLIRPYGRDDGGYAIPWGIVNIASYLKKYGYAVTVIDRKDTHYPIRKIIKDISRNNIAYVGISAMTSQAKDAEFLCNHLKKTKKKIILGGFHYSILPEEGIKIADYVFKGEGELSLLHFLENGPKTRIYESEPLLELDEIPLPSEELISKFYLNRKIFTIMTSRGCPYNCSFCLDKKNKSNKVRYHSPAYVCDLLEMLTKSFDLKSFFIGDDIFTVNKERVLKICHEIKKRSLKIKLAAFSHSSINDLELYKEMKDAGFERLSLGVESGSDEVLMAMNKQQTVAQAKETIEIIKKAGLEVTVTFMVGNILETEESLKATLELAKKLDLFGWVSYAQPFPGTRFYAVHSQYGRLINHNPKTYWNDRITFVPSGVSKLKLRYYRDNITMALNKGHGYLITKLINKFYEQVLMKCLR